MRIESKTLAAKCSLFCPLPDAHMHAHTLVPGQNHERAHTHPHPRKEFSIFLCCFSFFSFFLKRTYPNIWIINHLRFLRNWVFSFPLWFWCFSSSLNLTSGLKLSFFFSFSFLLLDGRKQFELYLTLQREKWCERRRGG